MSPTPKIWDRWKEETKEAYALFQAYLFSPPPRTLKALSHDRGLSWQEVSTLAHRFSWTTRASEYDQHLATIHTETVEETIRERARRHVESVRSLFDLADREVRKLGKESGRAGMATLRPSEAAKLLVESIRLERELEAADVTTGPCGLSDADLARLDPDELETLARLVTKAQTGA